MSKLFELEKFKIELTKREIKMLLTGLYIASFDGNLTEYTELGNKLEELVKEETPNE